jgi:hypothetical protein
MGRGLVSIARDRPELWGTWASLYGAAGTVEVHFDRRQGQPETGRGDRPDCRARPNRDTDLHERGFFGIPEPALVGVFD